MIYLYFTSRNGFNVGFLLATLIESSYLLIYRFFSFPCRLTGAWINQERTATQVRNKIFFRGIKHFSWEDGESESRDIDLKPKVNKCYFAILLDLKKFFCHPNIYGMGCFKNFNFPAKKLRKIQALLIHMRRFFFLFSNVAKNTASKISMLQFFFKLIKYVFISILSSFCIIFHYQSIKLSVHCLSLSISHKSMIFHKAFICV